MKPSVFHLIAPLLVLASESPATACPGAPSDRPGYFEPERGPAVAAVEPYDVLVHTVLVGKRPSDVRCELLALGAVAPSWYVRLTRSTFDRFRLESRGIRKEFLLDVADDLARSVRRAGRGVPLAVSIPESDLRLLTTSTVVEVDAATGALIVAACDRALRRVEHAKALKSSVTVRRIDGIDYHASNGDRFGRAWGPKRGTVAELFVRLAEEMKRFADLPAGQRDRGRRRLRLRSKELLRCVPGSEQRSVASLTRPIRGSRGGCAGASRRF